MAGAWERLFGIVLLVASSPLVVGETAQEIDSDGAHIYHVQQMNKGN